MFDEAVLAVIRAHGTRYVWHYTRCDALPSIVEHGVIYSRAELERRGIRYRSTHYYGSARHEDLLKKYVSCAPLPPWGMMGTEEKAIAVLRLDARVLAIPDTCFCPGWSPWGQFNPDEIVTWTGPDPLEELYAGTGPTFIYPCEMFVPGEVPTMLVQGIVFFDTASRDAARGPMLEAARKRSGVTPEHKVPISVEPARFPRSWQESGPPWEDGADAPTV